MLRLGGASEPVQARDLFDLSTAISQAWHATSGQQSRETAISYAAYRLLVWRASYGANLERTFAQLTGRLRGLCLSPDFTRASGGSAAALGNRIGAAAIASGRHDGSNEALHYADPSYAPVERAARRSVRRLDGARRDVLAAAGALAEGRPGRRLRAGGRPDLRGLAVGPRANVRGACRCRARRGSATRRAPPTSRPPSPRSAPRRGRATRPWWTHRRSAGTGSPRLLPAGTGAAARLAHDVRLDLALNGALNDAAVSAWGAKRAYQSPRPISIIRYLAFNDQLPLVPGLIKRVGTRQLVLRAGRWVPGARWSPLAPTPPSPGWASGDSAFAYAADEVLTAFAGRSFAREAALAAAQGAERGTELPGDVTAGRALGTKVGKLVLRKLAG